LNTDLTSAAREAMSELKSKDIKTIQIETAVKWCGRAVAAKLLGLSDRDVTEFAHESIEHAALSGDDSLLRKIRSALAQLNIEV
jgi:hypothetical protein